VLGKNSVQVRSLTDPRDKPSASTRVTELGASEGEKAQKNLRGGLERENCRCLEAASTARQDASQGVGQIGAEPPEVLVSAPLVKAHMRHGQQRPHCASIGMNRRRMCNLPARRGRWRKAIIAESVSLMVWTTTNRSKCPYAWHQCNSGASFTYLTLYLQDIPTFVGKVRRLFRELPSSGERDRSLAKSEGIGRITPFAEK
jgi:hypothetical protein